MVMICVKVLVSFYFCTRDLMVNKERLKIMSLNELGNVYKQTYSPTTWVLVSKMTAAGQTKYGAGLR